jgi:hypothetical protein
MYFLCCSVYLCVVLCIVCFMFCVLFVCICVLCYCQRVATQLQLNISYHASFFPLLYIFFFIVLYHLCLYFFLRFPLSHGSSHPSYLMQFNSIVLCFCITCLFPDSLVPCKISTGSRSLFSAQPCNHIWDMTMRSASPMPAIA